MRRNCGWIYREPAVGVTPSRIRVEIKDQDWHVFNDNATGAKEAADYITSQLGDDWKLEDMMFLGYRIVGPDKEDK